nr:PREDICTED: extensin-like [Bemisia tabaci]
MNLQIPSGVFVLLLALLISISAVADAIRNQPEPTKNDTTPATPPTTTPSPKTTTTAKPTTTTTPAPNSTTVAPTTSSTPTPHPSPAPTTPRPSPAPTTPHPSPAPTTPKPTPAPENRKFDGPSFIGGIVLTIGLLAIGFVSYKFYMARTNQSYHTL